MLDTGLCVPRVQRTVEIELELARGSQAARWKDDIPNFQKSKNDKIPLRSPFYDTGLFKNAKKILLICFNNLKLVVNFKL